MSVHDEMNTLYANINRLRAAIAALLRAMADEIEPVRQIHWDEDGMLLLSKVEAGKPIHVPDEWVDWQGKTEGAPRPGIIWFSSKPEVPLDQVECRAKLDGTLPPGCMLQDREEEER